MAEENNNNPAKNIADDVLGQQQQVPLPSTEEAQLETQAALEPTEEQKKFEKLKKQNLKRLKSIPGNRDAEGIAEEAAIQALENEKLEAQRKQEKELEKQEDQRAAAQESLGEYIQRKNRAEALGISLPTDPEKEALLQEAQTTEEQAVKENIPVNMETLQEQTTPSVADVEREAEQIKTQNAQVAAQQKVQEEDLEDLQQQQLEAAKRVEQAELSQSKIDPDRFWKNKSTGEKILAGIAVFLGGMGRGQNNALNIIQGAIDRDIESQKLNNKQKLQVANNAFKAAQLKIDQMLARSKNEQMQQKGLLLKEQLEQQRLQRRQMLQQAELQEIRRAAILRQQATGQIDPSMLSDDERERIVRLPNGSIQLADNKTAAVDVRKFVNETQPAIDNLDKLATMAKSGEFSRLDPRDRALIDQQRQQLIGQLRLSLVGPGALTEKELEIIKETIGNPNKMIFKDTEVKKINSLMKNLQGRINQRYKNAGIRPPIMQGDKVLQASSADSVNERNIQKLIQNNPKLSKQSAERALKQLGKWAE